MFHADFVLNGLQFLRPSLLDMPVGQRHYQHIVANPPYFKVNTEDTRRQAAEELLSGHTNIYTVFMGLAVRMLKGGRACFIVPRSFCSGAYFTRFRQEFLNHATVLHVHLFEARDDAFRRDDVLQENLVITFIPRDGMCDQLIDISSSLSLEAIANGIPRRQITQEQFISPSGLFRLPTSEIDEMILDAVDRWSDNLQAYGMDISTGRVVPFRATQHLDVVGEPLFSIKTGLYW